MSQIDITAYSPIIIWSWISILISFLYLYSFTFPNFINKIKSAVKVKNIALFIYIFNFNKIKNINKYFLILELKNLIKNKKKLWNI